MTGDLDDEIRRQHRETREAIAGAERRLRTCLLISIGVATLILAGLILALSSVLLSHAR